MVLSGEALSNIIGRWRSFNKLPMEFQERACCKLILETLLLLYRMNLIDKALSCPYGWVDNAVKCGRANCEAWWLHQRTRHEFNANACTDASIRARRLSVLHIRPIQGAPVFSQLAVSDDPWMQLFALDSYPYCMSQKWRRISFNALGSACRWRDASWKEGDVWG